ncbi:zinc finger protein CONSTANS-LIKE 4-like [Olea europaea var. sylvestris]|uniref:zinc finger protein CONSTANS-LIKE 4-like n=1 Tax=Olea europaea var. sylvestris TaxID=158386 RepID=UPI000C1D5199|nr:zinc finger protein CONSTANS-LIKE 4-like [Olea europaea var. sylvestris]
MGGKSWSLKAKLCDSCKSSPASVFCHADTAFLCHGCDARVHDSDEVASHHARVLVCEVCEQAPAIVTCKADAAALCATCDRDIHCANPLARRHERLPIVSFYKASQVNNNNENKYFSEDEAEAASWLLPNPHTKGGTTEDDDADSSKYKSSEYLFSDMDPYLDLDIISGENMNDQKKSQYISDGVVPVQNKNDFQQNHFQGSVVDGFPTYDMDYNTGSKPFMYNFSSQSVTQSVSSSSMEVCIVPDPGSITDVSNTLVKNDEIPSPVSGIDREARVLRYKEKRKNRKFEKTIRYASRKAYAETRPRIKGRFAKRSENGVESLMVPTF